MQNKENWTYYHSVLGRVYFNKTDFWAHLNVLHFFQILMRWRYDTKTVCADHSVFLRADLLFSYHRNSWELTPLGLSRLLPNPHSSQNCTPMSFAVSRQSR